MKSNGKRAPTQRDYSNKSVLDVFFFDNLIKKELLIKYSQKETWNLPNIREKRIKYKQ